MAGQATSPAKLRRDQQEGVRAGINGTPTFFLGTMTKDGKVHAVRRLVGSQPYDAFKAAMDALLSSPEVK
jgi:protein-disulfide isomerase